MGNVIFLAIDICKLCDSQRKYLLTDAFPPC